MACENCAVGRGEWILSEIRRLRIRRNWNRRNRGFPLVQRNITPNVKSETRQETELWYYPLSAKLLNGKRLKLFHKHGLGLVALFWIPTLMNNCLSWIAKIPWNDMIENTLELRVNPDVLDDKTREKQVWYEVCPRMPGQELPQVFFVKLDFTHMPLKSWESIA